jgi:uncharacterized protein YoxC
VENLQSFIDMANGLPWPMFLLVVALVGVSIWYLQVIAPTQEDLVRTKELLSTNITQIDTTLAAINTEIAASKALQEVLRAEMVRLAVDVNTKLTTATQLIETHVAADSGRNRAIIEDIDTLKDAVTNMGDKLDNLKERMIIISTTLNSRHGQSNNGA